MSNSADTKQNRDVSADFVEQRGICFRVKNCLARFPVHALEVIDQHCPFHLIHNNWESERIRFSLAGERANDNQTTGAIVGLIR